MAPAFVESLGFTAGRKVAGELSKAESPFIALLACHLRLLPPGRGSKKKKKWEDGRMTEITGRVLPFTSHERSEAEGIKESYKGPLCFPDLFLSRDNRELWISGGHFRRSDNLRTRRFQDESDFGKLAMLSGDLS